MPGWKRKGFFAFLLAITLAAAVALPSTIAYIVRNSQQVKNVFVPDSRVVTDASVVITAQKTVRNTGTLAIGPENFAFVLKNTASQEELLATSDADGKAIFPLYFSGMEAGRYSYTLSEVNCGRENVTYSEAVYQIDVIVLYENEQLLIKVLLDGVETDDCTAHFENIYAAYKDEPLTGDETPLLLYSMLMLLSGAVLMQLTVRKQKRE